jgi:hypothetical protein
VVVPVLTVLAAAAPAAFTWKAPERWLVSRARLEKETLQAEQILVGCTCDAWDSKCFFS